MNTRTAALIACSLTAMLAPGLASAQDARATIASDADLGATGEDIIVTGTRVAGRQRLDTASPVDVLSAAALRSQGTSELGQALSNVTPSIDFPRSAAVDGTDSIRPATLRGLSPDQTLVLINGIRGHASALLNTNGSVGRGSAAFDLNTVPTVALDRVEVLRDGASAQYGSDAIAGVINLRLREARSGGGASASYGQYETSVDTARQSRDRHDGKTYNASVWQGFGLGENGFLTISGDYLKRGYTSRGDLDRRVTPNDVTSRFGDPEVEQYTVFANFGAPVNDVWSVYGYAGYQNRDSTGAAFPRLATNANNVAAIYPTGFLPKINVKSDDINSALGIRGELSTWNVDLSVSYGRNELTLHTRNSINSTYGAASPTDFYDGKLIYDQIVGGLDVSKKFDFAEGNSLNVAWGVEYRNEGFEIREGQVESYARGPLGATTTLGSGAQGFQGFSPANALSRHRDNVSGYIDLEAQLGKLLLGLAARGESYSDFGETGTGKFSARYDLTDSFALRGTVSTGFRAPSLQQQYYTLTQPQVTNVNGAAAIVDTGTFPSTSPVATALGGKALDAEKSFNLSGGFVFRSGGFDLTVDAYRIKLRDQLALSDNLGTGVNASPAITALLRPFNVSAARFFVNGIRSTTKGIDLVAHYRVATDAAGNFDFTVAGNLNDVKLTRVPTGTGTITVPALFGQQRIVSIEDGTPGEKLTGQVDWNKSGFGGLVRATYYGSVTQPASSLVDYVETGKHVIVDAELRAPLFGKSNVAIGVNNLFDVYPDRVPDTNVINYNNGGTAFPYYSPFGFNGRFLYARVNLAW
ncbi:TonB-dependent siderophore receptor [Novosphingobium sp. 9U]|uniref:TonB-dependent receptor plug domain-containing protein n=1 Tax=Novosphingobium sp. 9U TaxID=2653158 RepID=UPI0012F1EFF4|nr:TonB-dependent receptor [Novosphingobium sp. 9U]VWX47285.1 TonB-dependent receptor [Novosphingobium sp. 9U]